LQVPSVRNEEGADTSTLCACRYDFLHKKGILLPDDAFRERCNGEGGHMKLWTVVEKVEADLVTAVEQYTVEMSDEQSHFAENINFVSNHVNRLSSYTDMAKVPILISAVALKSSSLLLPSGLPSDR
jgi:hypothetical protein